MLAPNLFQELFQMYELKTVMHQKFLGFASLLNRLREGLHTAEDIDRLQQRVMYLSDPDLKTKFPLYSPLLRHLFARNVDLDNHNQTVLDCVPSPTVTIEAKDFVISRFVPKSQKEYFLSRAKTMPATNTSSLPSVLPVKLGLVVEITLNISDDGLFNGAWGYIRKFDLDEASVCHTIWIQFADSSIGLRTRKLYSSVYKRFSNIDRLWTPVHRTNRQFTVTSSPLSHCASETVSIAARNWSYLSSRTGPVPA